MQPSSPTYASACHSRPFPLRFWPQGTHGTLPSLKVTAVPSLIPPSLRLSVPPCLLSFCLSAALLFWGCFCLASLHALLAVFFPLLPAARHVGDGERGHGFVVWLLLQVGLKLLLWFRGFLQRLESQIGDAKGLFQARTRRGGKGKGND